MTFGGISTDPRSSNVYLTTPRGWDNHENIKWGGTAWRSVFALLDVRFGALVLSLPEKMNSTITLT